MGQVRVLSGLPRREICMFTDIPFSKHYADLDKAFKHDEYYQLVMHRPQAPPPANVHSRDSPMRARPSGRVHNRSVYGRRWVPDTQAVFVGDLPLDVVEDEIREVLSTYGRIQCVDILRRDVENSEHCTLTNIVTANFVLRYRREDLCICWI